MIAYLLYIILIAVIRAVSDSADILANKSVRHGYLWRISAGFAVGMAVEVVFFGDKSWWMLVPMLTGGAAIFATIHRFALNKLRGKAWWYLGARLGDRRPDASKIDTAWHWFAWWMCGSKERSVEPHFLGEWQQDYPDRSPAICAFTVEAIAYLISAWILIPQ